MSRTRLARVRETTVSSVVVDASVAAVWFAPEAGSAAALELLRASRRLTAPDFMAVETANVMWKKHRRGEMRAAEVDHSLATLFMLGIVWFPSRDILGRASRLARDIEHPVYDCLYLVLAQDHGVPLATFDGRLQRAARHVNVPLLALKGKT